MKQRWEDLVSFLLLAFSGLASSRWLYELLFPRWSWLGRSFSAILLALMIGSLIWLLWRRRLPWWAGLPLLLNGIYLFVPASDLVANRLWFGASLWLAALLAQAATAERDWQRRGIFFLLAALLPVFLLTMPLTVGRADTFEFQVVAPRLGIAHPTGYPLYLLLGKLFTLLPFGSVAWRLNIGTMVFGLVALSLLYLVGLRLYKRPFPPLLAALAVGLTPTFWSQAIEAEVYTLHSLVVACALWQMVSWLEADEAEPQRAGWLAATIGLGLTNHLTSVFVLPPAGLTALFKQGQRRFVAWGVLVKTAVFFLIPLLLYLYLPWRWQVVNGEPMGIGRFIDWVVGGRFQDALQWSAWLNDPARYEIVGRLYLANWGWFNLALAVLGFAWLLWQRWRVALILGVTWLGYSFYALNYYVPDLEVFVLPGHLVVGLCWAGGITAVSIAANRLVPPRFVPAVTQLLPLLFFLPTLALIPTRWPQLNRAVDDGLLTWGAGVLQQPLAPNAAILADSEKIAPLYYLQQAEGVRPDLEIMVLPDEAAYRAELNGRLAQNQPVYLARFLPGLEGSYHLRSAGPLTEVSTEPLTRLPEKLVFANQPVSPLTLIGYVLEPAAAVDPTATAIIFYWQAAQPVTEQLRIYLRWQGELPVLATGQHPANDDYPLAAWKGDEIVADFHLLPQPISAQPQRRTIEVALAPPFAPAADLAWTAVAEVELPATAVRSLKRPLRAQLGSLALSGIDLPTQIRPQTPLPVTLAGYGTTPESLTLTLQPMPHSSPNRQSPNLPIANRPFLTTHTLTTDLPNGRYAVVGEVAGETAVCHWLAQPTTGCVLGEIEISGVPLPPTATNFADKIALLDVALEQTTLASGGQLDLTLTWQALAPLDENYTVFIQLLDAQDQIVGQVDAWPRQGTYPTSQWSPGETITDPYQVQLAADLPPGDYRLHIGFYLLATLQRLPILDESGAPVADSYQLGGLLAGN